MLVLCNSMIGIAQILGMVLSLFYWVFIIHAVLSWFSPDPNNFLVRMITELTEPILKKVRPYIPPLGMLDLSVIVVILGLMLAQNVVVDSLRGYGQACLISSAPAVVSGG